ncbi:ketosynthase [Streptomyces sp. NPDC005538]|uniref:ketosynthase n=1 Tax=unclassified Streptomyces TaxID=2593676 RepID=UPI0033AF9351
MTATSTPARAVLAAACRTPWGGAAAGLPGAAPVELPRVVGFVTSRFSPLVHAVATECLGAPGTAEDLVGAAGPRTGIVLATMFGDTVTLDTATRRLTEGQVHSPLLFFQSVTTSILGHLGKTYGITGPVECLSVARDGAAEALFAADLMLDQDDVDQVLLIGLELAANERATWVLRRTAGDGGLDPLPDGDCGVALLLAREPADGTTPSRLGVTPAATEAALPDSRYARFGWLAPLVAACETVRPPDGVPVGPVRVPGWHGYVVEPVEPVLSGSAA